tara:strand:- start:44 stop:289 length:246 start_codon:yes stop_codon:yes gene_type:complete
MARRKPKTNTGFVLFDVVYEDGSLSSNRKVPATELEGLDGDDPALAFLEEQEAKIEAASGRKRVKIKSIARSDSKKASAKS